MKFWRRKPKAPVTEYQVYFRDSQEKYSSQPNPDGLKLIFIHYEEKIAHDWLVYELNEQYGISWFYNASTNCYHIFGGDHAVLGYVRRVAA